MPTVPTVPTVSDTVSATVRTSQASWFMATEYTVGAGFIVLLAVAIFLFSKYWERWQSDVVAKVFVAFDADSSGSIKQEELWAGVLQFYGKHPACP